ncbi:ArnT family glycosyltransferase [Actinoplanes couchii]|uniref:ArnT family glycosyltransferase n=1 Tax=Actinoplanes couchii TaxID=403638 RepID=UPI001EF2A71C|nr:phospholipid carrier-dependent glycosyltransferase [Actinoplanes couchii]MDR6319561.1 4-amino-4-deoxy-L-arabinose transferase-like glycosyltransferase [Actinoplanes couchii]
MQPKLLVPLLLVQMAIVMIVTAVQQTPTIDEPVYVGTAVTYLEQHSLRYNPEHPPLGKLIIASGLALAQPHLDPEFAGNQSELGRHVLYEAGNEPGLLMLLARLPMIVLTLLFGLVVFAFARDLTDTTGGLLALSMFAFSPDVLTHGSLATLDLPTAGFLLTAVWLTWRARTARPWCHLALAGAALGMALATRASALPALPLVLFLAYLSVRRWVVLPLVAGVATVVVWLSYLAVDPGLHWVAPDNMPDIHGWRAVLTDLLPFPEPYRDGMRMQFAMEDSTFRGFLFGERYEGALWYYLPAALLVKTPLGMLAAWIGGLYRTRGVAALYVLVPPALLLAVAMTGARNYGTRYAIVVPLFLAVAAAGLVVVRRMAMVLVIVVAASSMTTFPYYLPYSNEAFGGPSRTHLHLHDANVDWGQDLGRLGRHLRERYPGEPVWLVYKGAGVPEAYAITARNPLLVRPSEVHGLLVVSNSAVALATGRLATLLATSGPPIDEVGHSMSIYRRPSPSP